MIISTAPPATNETSMPSTGGAICTCVLRIHPARKAPLRIHLPTGGEAGGDERDKHAQHRWGDVHLRAENPSGKEGAAQNPSADPVVGRAVHLQQVEVDHQEMTTHG